MIRGRNFYLRLLCVIIIACLSVTSALATDVPLASQLAADLLRDAGQRHPRARSLCERLADGLASGRIAIDEAVQLMELARITGLLSVEEQAASRPPRDDDQRARFAEALEALDEMPSPHASAEDSAPALVEEAPPSERDLATVTAVIRAGEDDNPLIYAAIDRGSAAGLDEGRRLYLVRDDQQVAMLRVVRVDEDMAIAVLLDASWSDDYTGERSLKKDDRVEVVAPAQP